MKLRGADGGRLKITAKLTELIKPPVKKKGARHQPKRKKK